MKIPTIFFINKIDQNGIDLPMVYQEMKAKLSVGNCSEAEGWTAS